MTAEDKAPGNAGHVPGAQNSTSSPAILHSNSSAAQRNRIASHLGVLQSATTIELRRDLDVMMPAARIFELRHRHGLNIEMQWIKQATDCGKVHRVALYTLRPGSYRSAASNDDQTQGAAA